MTLAELQRSLHSGQGRPLIICLTQLNMIDFEREAKLHAIYPNDGPAGQLRFEGHPVTGTICHHSYIVFDDYPMETIRTI